MREMTVHPIFLLLLTILKASLSQEWVSTNTDAGPQNWYDIASSSNVPQLPTMDIFGFHPIMVAVGLLLLQFRTGSPSHRAAMAVTSLLSSVVAIYGFLPIMVIIGLQWPRTSAGLPSLLVAMAATSPLLFIITRTYGFHSIMAEDGMNLAEVGMKPQAFGAV